MSTHTWHKFVTGRQAEKREWEVWMDQIVKCCIKKQKNPQKLIQPQGRRKQWTTNFTWLLSLLFTENCMVTRANATSDELSVIYVTSPSVKHTCTSQSRGLVLIQICLLLNYGAMRTTEIMLTTESLKLYNSPFPSIQTFWCVRRNTQSLYPVFFLPLLSISRPLFSLVSILPGSQFG